MSITRPPISPKAVIWGAVRIALGVVWLIGGTQKVFTADAAHWLGDGAGSAVRGFLYGSLARAGSGYNAPPDWYAELTRSIFIPNAVAFSYLVALGEFLVGLALILGLFTRFAAAMGLIMITAFIFAGSTDIHVWLLMFQSPIVFADTDVGHYGIDGLLIAHITRGETWMRCCKRWVTHQWQHIGSASLVSSPSAYWAGPLANNCWPC